MLLQGSDAENSNADDEVLQNSNPREVMSDFGPSAPHPDNYLDVAGKGLLSSAAGIDASLNAIRLGADRMSDQDSTGNVLSDMSNNRPPNADEQQAQINLQSDMNALQDLRPDPRNTGFAKNLLFNVAGIAPNLLATTAITLGTGGAGAAPAAAAFFGLPASVESEYGSAAQGISPGAATAIAVPTGVIGATVGSLPGGSAISSIPLRMGAAAVFGAGVAQGQRSYTHAVLDAFGYPEMAKQFEGLDNASDLASSAIMFATGEGVHALGGSHALEPENQESKTSSQLALPAPQKLLSSPISEANSFLVNAYRAVESASPIEGFEPTESEINPFDEAINRIRDNVAPTFKGEPVSIPTASGEVPSMGDKIAPFEFPQGPPQTEDSGSNARDALEEQQQRNISDIGKENKNNDFISALQVSMQKFINQYGVDINSLTNEQIKDTIGSYVDPEVNPSTLDAAMVVKDATNFEDNSPGIPADVESRTAHTNAMNEAMRDVAVNDRAPEPDDAIQDAKFIERPFDPSNINDWMKNGGVFDLLRELRDSPEHELSDEDRSWVDGALKDIEDGRIQQPSEPSENIAESTSHVPDVIPMPDGTIKSTPEAEAAIEDAQQQAQKDKNVVEALADCAIENLGSM